MTDELVALFAPPPPGPAQPVAYRQGTVVTYNPVTAENSVDVGGTVLTDLPILNTSEALLLAPGAVVACLVIGATVAIIGRLTIPGSADAATALQAIGTAGAFDTTNGTTTTNGYVDLAGTNPGPAVTIMVRAGGRVKVTLSAQAECTFSTTAGAKVAMSFEVSGATAQAPANDRAMVFYQGFSAIAGPPTEHYIIRASYVHFLDNLNPGQHTFTAKYSAGSSGTTAQFADRTIIVESI